MIPGEILTQDGDIKLNAERPTATLAVANSGDRPIQVGSHYHFFDTNRALQFDRAAGYGCRLDIPSGTAVRFEPGQSKEVTLVPFGGNRAVSGLNGLNEGPTDEAAKAAALQRARERGFKGA